MAESKWKLGETRFGDGKNVQAAVHVLAKPVQDHPGLLILDAVADSTGVITPYYLWVDSDGKLRISSTLPTNQNSDGTIVGTQS